MRGQTKSAYVRGLIAERLQSTDDLLRLAGERWGEGLGLKQR